MEQDTPALDRTARTVAESVYAGYMRHAQGRMHPQMEQNLLARLVEAIGPEVPGGTPRDIIEAANRVLDAWEQQSGDVRGPRVSALNRAEGSVAMEAAS